MFGDAAEGEAQGHAAMLMDEAYYGVDEDDSDDGSGGDLEEASFGDDGGDF